jgi:hypothetical protein
MARLSTTTGSFYITQCQVFITTRDDLARGGPVQDVQDQTKLSSFAAKCHSQRMVEVSGNKLTRAFSLGAKPH